MGKKAAKSNRRRQSRTRSDAAAQVQSFEVFLSHATYDKWIAKVLCEKLEGLGAQVHVWRDDRDIEGGDQIPDKIKKAIHDCDEFVVLLTPESVNREWVLIELGAAWHRGCRIVPLYYHVDQESVPNIIRDTRGFHLNELDDYLKGLKERIGKS